MGKTKIEWTERTWNPITGCTKVSAGCRGCYAERMSRRLAGRFGYPEAPNHFDVTLHPDRRDEPVRRRKPTTYFVCSMGDLFHEDVEWADIAEVWEVMAWAEQHTFQVLTKRPERMLEFLVDFWLPSDFYSGTVLPNVWLGTSIEDQPTADERIPLLLQAPAAKHFLSAEPLLGAINITDQPWWDWRYTYDYWKVAYPDAGPPIDWVIVGGETGPGARPMHPEWARSIRDQCVAAGVPFFFKQRGAWTPGATRNEPFGPAEVGERCIEHDGKWTRMYRVGKKIAGRLLDGREWNEMPEVRHANQTV